MYMTKTPQIVKRLFPAFFWQDDTVEKVLYLTFDDGPIPEITPWVLEQLAAFDAKATFFCVGDNVQKHPDIFAQVVAAGHTVGNHTMHHRNGWNTDYASYLHDVAACREFVGTNWFRPPYGRITPGQSQALRALDYRIVMWDVLSGDFDPKLDPEDCLQEVIGASEAGSIIVFHDSVKSFDRLKVALPGVLSHFKDLGYRFENMDYSLVESNW
jgi:peptidoglycan-N-acetylglucosamine deacetylase